LSEHSRTADFLIGHRMTLETFRAEIGRAQMGSSLSIGPYYSRRRKRRSNLRGTSDELA
jgi:hypothetical protein